MSPKQGVEKPAVAPVLPEHNFIIKKLSQCEIYMFKLNTPSTCDIHFYEITIMKNK